MEKKDFTLITFIGKNDTKYETLDYIFPEKGKDEKNERVKTNSTALALIEAKEQHWNITRVIIVGTYTSRWGELVKEDDNKELHVELEEKSKLSFKTDDEVDILDASLDKMVDFLQEKYGIEIIPVAHRPDLSDNTVLEIAEYYDGIFNYIEDTSNILVDITHGFRHMPLLLFQMLQQHLLLLEDKTVEIIYGEMKKEEGISTFRDLKKYWDVTKHTNALNRFLTQYDGDGLVPYLEEIKRSDIAKWIHQFSLIIKADHVMQIYSLVDPLKEIIQSQSEQQDCAPWLQKLIAELESIYENLSKSDQVYDLYLEFADLLEKKHLVTQATIAIAAAIETRMAVYEARRDRKKDETIYIGDYYKWSGLSEKKEEIDDKKKNQNPRGFKSYLKGMLTKEGLLDLFNEFYDKRRNLIAHGGGDCWNKIVGDEQYSLKKYFDLADSIFKMLDVKEMAIRDNKMIDGTIGDSVKIKEEKRNKKK